jgi:hypothetical protein
MTIRCEDGVLTVDAPVSNYVIEPLRFELGFSRVEMVDDHLTRLVRDGRRTGHPLSGDAEALLRARARFLRDSQRAVDQSH